MWCWEFHEVGLGNSTNWGLQLGYFTCLFPIGFLQLHCCKTSQSHPLQAPCAHLRLFGHACREPQYSSEIA